MADTPHTPSGFVFFSERAPARRRRRRTVFVLIVLTATSALIWPIYPLFGGGVYPLILGMPLSLAWVVLWLFIVFGALVWLYQSDEVNPSSTAPPAGHD